MIILMGLQINQIKLLEIHSMALELLKSVLSLSIWHNRLKILFQVKIQFIYVFKKMKENVYQNTILKQIYCVDSS